ncbi:hypothetical protein QUC31_007088 [Theobroma cacao]
MDVDLWPSKVHSSKHLSVVRAARLNSDNQQECRKESDCGVLYGTCEDECEDETEDGELDYESNCDEDGHYDDFDGDEDTRACFPCPFCYVEIEIHALCNHLQEEHCFDMKNSVCPLCAANLGKDVIGHFIVQHASSLKRRRKSQKSGCWPGTPATLSRELSLFIGSSTGDRDNAHESAPDLILSPFLCNAPVSDTKDILRDKCSDGETSVTSNLKRVEVSNQDNLHTELNYLFWTRIMNRIQKREGKKPHLFYSWSCQPSSKVLIYSPGCVNQHWVFSTGDGSRRSIIIIGIIWEERLVKRNMVCSSKSDPSFAVKKDSPTINPFCLQSSRDKLNKELMLEIRFSSTIK